MKPQLPKGTKDIPVEKKIIKNKVVDTIKKIFEIYGYSPLETPILERYETLSAKFAAGEGSDALKQTFKLKDQGGRKLGLRYDLTVPFARYIAMNPNIKMPFKRYQIGQVFRDGPIKLGRYREFWQCDADIVGVKEMSAEAEIIALAKDIFNRLGLNIIIRINNRKLLNGILSSIGIKENKIEDVILTIDKIEKIPLKDFKKELRKKCTDKQIKEIIKIFKENNIELIKGKIDNEEGRQGIREIKKLQMYLTILGINAKIDISLARGLAYYTGTVFEIFLRDSEIKSSFAAGGRYDKMIANFIGRGDYPAVGISFGDIICDAIKKTAKLTVADVYIIPIRNLDKAFVIARKLRKANIKTDIDLMEKGLSKNLEYADVKKIPYVLICGPDELKQNKVKLKDMITGKEELININEIVDELKDLVKYDL